MTGTRSMGMFVGLALIAASCGSDVEPSASSGAVTTTTGVESGPLPEEIYGDIGAGGAEPGSVVVTLDDASAASAEIGASGGLITASAGGVTYTLTIPEGALLSAETITVTPLAAATGEPIGQAPFGAVHLAPSGMGFLKPFELRVTGLVLDSEPVGFGASGSGEDFHLVAADDTGDGSFVVLAMHFSTLGVAGREQLEPLVRSYRPSGAEQLARAALTLVDGEDHARSFAILEVWAQALRVGLQGTASTEALEDRTIELLSLVQAVAQELDFAIDDGWDEPPESLQEVMQDIIDLWFVRVGDDVERYAGFCRETPADAFMIYRWIAIATAMGELLTLERDDTLTVWRDSAENCLQFELDWDAVVNLSDDEVSTRAAGTAHIIIDEHDSELIIREGEWALYIQGRGDWAINSLQFEDCTPVYTPVGSATGWLAVGLDLPNPGSANLAEITGIDIAVTPSDPPSVRCQEAIDVGVEVDWGPWFYSTPIGQVNAPRGGNYGWGFSVETSSDTGVMGSVEVTDSQTLGGTRGTVTQELTVRHAPGG